MLSSAELSTPAPKRRTGLGRLARPAIVLLILVNVVYFAGNAAIDLWQVNGPTDPFSGAITTHERVVTSGENASEYYVLKVATRRGDLQMQIPEKAFNDTASGQQVTGALDARGIFGHDQALRSLGVDGHVVYASSPLRRSLAQAIVFAVVMCAGVLALRWTLRGETRRPVERTDIARVNGA